ncbi:MAG: hypothetical protein QXZ70_05550 [Candidatus Bathyarchaeia archaeon]
MEFDSTIVVKKHTIIYSVRAVQDFAFGVYFLDFCIFVQSELSVFSIKCGYQSDLSTYKEKMQNGAL